MSDGLAMIEERREASAGAAGQEGAQAPTQPPVDSPAGDAGQSAAPSATAEELWDIAQQAPQAFTRAEDGTYELDLRKLPQRLRVRLEDGEKNAFSREDFDYRYRSHSIRLEKLAEERKAIEAERQRIFLEDGRSKAEAYDSFEAELRTDPVGLSARMLAKMNPDAWSVLQPAFAELKRRGLYNPEAIRASRAETRLQRIEQERLQQEQDRQAEQVVSQARQYLSEQVGRDVSIDEWEEVEDHYLALLNSHEVNPERFPKPTILSAYESAQRQRGGTAAPAAAPQQAQKPVAAKSVATPKPRTERATAAVGGGAPAMSGLDLIAARRAAARQRAGA